jgi:hypothetical protein
MSQPPPNTLENLPSLEMPSMSQDNKRLEDESTSTSEFHLFPKLPLELRQKIWQSALPGPRFIEIVSESCFKSHSPPFTSRTTYGWKQGARSHCLRCKERAPILFFVCKESRLEVTRTYLHFPTIFCGFNVDTLTFAKSTAPNIIFDLPTLLKKNVRSLAAVPSVIEFCILTKGLEKSLDMFEGLKEIMVCKDSRHYLSSQYIVGSKDFLEAWATDKDFGWEFSSGRPFAQAQALEALESRFDMLENGKGNGNTSRPVIGFGNFVVEA